MAKTAGAGKAPKLSSAEKKLVNAVEAAIKKIGAKTDVGGTTVWDASTDPVGVGLSPFGGDDAARGTPDVQSKIEPALAGTEAGTVEPCQPNPSAKHARPAARPGGPTSGSPTSTPGGRLPKWSLPPSPAARPEAR